MTTITIELPRERAQRLKEKADEFGLSMEELARVGVEDLLSQPDEQFDALVRHLVKKNADLYKRLAA